MSYLLKITIFVFIVLTISCFTACKSDENPNNLLSKNNFEKTDLDSTQEMGRITFESEIEAKDINIKAIATKSNNNLLSVNIKITAVKHKIDSLIHLDLDGKINFMKLADLDSNGIQELYIFNTSEGSGMYGQILAYQLNTQAIDNITLMPLEEKQEQGYKGNDSFAIQHPFLLRYFPIYKNLDANCCPTGGTRKIKYTLVNKKSRWYLKVAK